MKTLYYFIKNLPVLYRFNRRSYIRLFVTGIAQLAIPDESKWKFNFKK